MSRFYFQVFAYGSCVPLCKASLGMAIEHTAAVEVNANVFYMCREVHFHHMHGCLYSGLDGNFERRSKPSSVGSSWQKTRGELKIVSRVLRRKWRTVTVAAHLSHILMPFNFNNLQRGLPLKCCSVPAVPCRTRQYACGWSAQ
jgi:hypothetical protein